MSLDGQLPEGVGVAAFAHELKNAFAVLEGELAALARDTDHAQARTALAHAAEIRARLVSFLMLAQGGQDIRVVRDLHEPARFLQETVAELVLAGPVRRMLAVADAASPPAAGFDAMLVQRAIEGAIHNAARFAHGRIELRASACDGGVLFEVLDDGPGVQDAAGAVSTGLGLALARAIAAAHRRAGRTGWARLADRDDGRGARFSIWLP